MTSTNHTITPYLLPSAPTNLSPNQKLVIKRDQILLIMSSEKTRTPGRTRYAEGTTSGGWYFNTWLERRSMKIGKTSQAQDIARCYEAITPRMYQDNLAVKEYFRSMDYWAHRGFPQLFGGLVDPARYVGLKGFIEI
jgi:hypothetical protein